MAIMVTTVLKVISLMKFFPHRMQLTTVHRQTEIVFLTATMELELGHMMNRIILLLLYRTKHKKN